MQYDGSLRIWFDRDISFEAGSDLSADIVSLSCFITSRSSVKLSDERRLTSKESVKLNVVEYAINTLVTQAL